MSQVSCNENLKIHARIKIFLSFFFSGAWWVGVEIQTLILCIYIAFIDKLTKNLVEEATGRDFKENTGKPPSMKTTTHLDNLTNAIRSCGISFAVWEKTNADGKASGLFDFTSLMGSDKKILLKKLPSKLHQITSPDTSDTVVQLWKV